MSPAVGGAERGSAGVGKSTIAPQLARTAANGVCIRGDDIKSFVVTRAEPTTVELGLTYVGAAALADVYLAAGYALVVVDFIFERPDHVTRFTDALTSPADVLLITLWAPLDVIDRRRAERARWDASHSFGVTPESGSGGRLQGGAGQAGPSTRRQLRRHHPRASPAT